MSILTQFIFRLAFGMALGMALTNPRQVTSGYYRNHLYVLLGLNVLATMAAWSAGGGWALAAPLIAAVLSYVGAVVWLYEKPRLGVATLTLLAAVSLAGAWANTDWHRSATAAATLLAALDPLTGGLVLGMTIAAMFLGHWYLNTPTMAIEPLRRLVVLMGAAICLRAAVEALWLAIDFQTDWPTQQQLLFIALRWLSGIFGAFALVVMTAKTLNIPNTQSATGMLYVGVIVTFLGELMSLVLSSQLEYPM